MRSKRTLPAYAQSYERAIQLTSHQFETLLKRKPPWVKDMVVHGEHIVRVTRLDDGSYWAEWRSGVVFWSSRWYEISKAAGERMYEFNTATERLLAADGSPTRAGYSVPEQG